MTDNIIDHGDEGGEERPQEDGAKFVRRTHKLRNDVRSEDERSQLALAMRMQEFVQLVVELIKNAIALEFLFKVMGQEDPSVKINMKRVPQTLGKFVFGKTVSKAGEESWSLASERASVAQELIARKVPTERIADYMIHRATYSDLLASWRRRGGNRGRQDQGALGFTSDGTQVVVAWDSDVETILNEDGAQEAVAVSGVVEIAEDGSRRMRLTRAPASPNVDRPPGRGPDEPTSEGGAPATPPAGGADGVQDACEGEAVPDQSDELEYVEEPPTECRMLAYGNVLLVVQRRNSADWITHISVEMDDAGLPVVHLHSARQYPTPNWIKPIIALQAMKQGRRPMTE